VSRGRRGSGGHHRPSVGEFGLMIRVSQIHSGRVRALDVVSSRPIAQTAAIPGGISALFTKPGLIGEVRQLGQSLGRSAVAQRHWTFGKRNLLLGSEAICGRGTGRREQRQFDGLSGLSRRRAHQRLGRRGAAGDAGDSRRPRRGACTIDGRGVPPRSFGCCGRNGRTQVLQRQYGVSFRRLLRPLQVAVRRTVHQRWGRAAIILSHRPGL
jgi:hypothetical protein